MIGFHGRELYSGQAIVQSDTTILNPPIKALIVWLADAAGDTLKFDDIEGTTHTVVLPPRAAGAAYPICIPVAMRKIHATTTTLDDAEMFGIR